MKIEESTGLEVERALLAGELGCPDCGGRLGPWGWARWRVVRRRGGEEERHRPRRSRCAVCAVTHVPIGPNTLLLRRDGVEVIGTVLAPLVPTLTPVGDAVEAVAVAARAASLRLAPVEPWSFASAASRGRLLSTTGWPWAAAG